MFERFTEPARSAIVSAHEEAVFLRHDWVGPEHLLLGVLRGDEGIAARALESAGVTIEPLRTHLVETVGRGALDASGSTQIPFTEEARLALEQADTQSRSLGDDSIGPEHLLLGLTLGPESTVTSALTALGSGPGEVATIVVGMLAETGGALHDQWEARRSVLALCVDATLEREGVMRVVGHANDAEAARAGLRELLSCSDEDARIALDRRLGAFTRAQIDEHLGETT